MSVTVRTIYIDKKIGITRETKQIENVKDRWIGDNNTDDEKGHINYIKRELNL